MSPIFPVLDQEFWTLIVGGRREGRGGSVERHGRREIKRHRDVPAAA